MPCLLYCVTHPTEPVSVANGVCDAAVQSREMLGVRLYWSNIDNPEAVMGDAESLKKAALQFHQVMREILAVTTPIPFRFPTFLESEEVLEQHLAPEQELYRDALERTADAVQYEVVGTWAVEQQADLAAPVSGREYLKRRQAGCRPGCGGREQAEECDRRLGARVARAAGAQDASLVRPGAAGQSRALYGVAAHRRRVGRN